jgi:hypothetical protein
MEVSVHGLSDVLSHHFHLKLGENDEREVSGRTFDIPVVIQTGYLGNTSQKSYSLSHLAQVRSVLF